MKIFVIKGFLKGMVKIDNKMHLVGDGFDSVHKVILFDGKIIKVIVKEDFGVSIVGFSAIDVVLLGSDDKVLGSGSLHGKTDINKIMIEYNKTNKNTKNYNKIKTNFVNDSDIELAKNVEETFETDVEQDMDNFIKDDVNAQITNNVINENSEENQTKIDINDENIDNLSGNKETDFDFVSSNLDYINDGINIDGNLNFESQVLTKNNEDIQEIILGKDDDIKSGVDFIMQNFDDKANSENYYMEIKNDLDKFLNSHPRNEELENKVWGSKWVKVNADYDYSVGVIFEDNLASIIAYAIPYDDFRQIDMDNLKFGEWLKISERDDENRGYFVYYQNAQTGEMLINTNN